MKFDAFFIPNTKQVFCGIDAKTHLESDKAVHNNQPKL